MIRKKTGYSRLFSNCLWILLLAWLAVLRAGCSLAPQSGREDVNSYGNISIRKLAGDWDFAAEDGNHKLIIERNVLKLAPEGDEFGCALDTDFWEELDGSSVISTWEGKGKASLAESGGSLTNTDGGARPWVLTARRKVAYSNADIAVEWSRTDGAHKHYGSGFALFLWKDIKNYVRISYGCRAVRGNHRIGVVKMIDNKWTTLLDSPGIGLYRKMRLRIRRDASAGRFVFSYATWSSDTGSWNDWQHAWSGTISDSRHFSSSHELYPVIACRKEGGNSETFVPKVNRYYQHELDIPAQRFWPDSPQCNIIDSGAGRPDYCLDAGVNRVLKLTRFCAVVAEPGGSSVEFMAASGDSPERASTIWINNGKWMSARELGRLTAAGALDGRRYVFLKARFNSDGTAQPTLTSVSFTGTPGNTYGACAFDTHLATVDNNEKVIVEEGIAKLAPDGDEFGNQLDLRNWRKAVGHYAESGGIVVALSGMGGNDHLERQTAYDDADVVVHWSNTYPDPATKPYGGCAGICLGRDSKNYVRILYFARKIGTPKCNFDTLKMIDGKHTLLDWTPGVGPQTSIKFRIRRRKSDNHFWVYYDIGAGWVLTWSGIVNHPGHFDTSHSLKPRVFAGRGTNSENWKPEADRYYQVTTDIPAQRFWNDSPEILVVNNSSVNYAFDAGKGKVWKLRDADCEKSEPGTSSVKFKLGASDTGKHADAAWIDKKWQIIEQGNANAAKGTYDGHRYIHVRAQLNSDGTDQPGLKSFLVHGSRVPK